MSSEGRDSRLVACGKRNAVVAAILTLESQDGEAAIKSVEYLVEECDRLRRLATRLAETATQPVIVLKHEDCLLPGVTR